MKKSLFLIILFLLVGCTNVKKINDSEDWIYVKEKKKLCIRILIIIMK